LGQQLADLWGDKPMLLARDAAALARVTAALRSNGVEAFLLVWARGSGRTPARVGAARCAPTGRHRGRHVKRVFDVDFLRCAWAGRPSSAPGSWPMQD
jgi:hypothetical protein